MDLIFWRHAEAVEVDLVGDDMARYLTPRGERQAARMAHWLERQLPDGARVFSSPAVRAEQTARALERKIRISPALAPLASVEQLLELAQWPQARHAMVVVGHQPVFGQCIARLLGLQAGECAVKKGAVWWLRYRERDGQGQAVVVTVQSPDYL